MSIATNINTRLIWLRGALDTAVKLSPNGGPAIRDAGQMNLWLLRVLEAQDIARQYALWCEKRLEFSRLPDLLSPRGADSDEDAGEEAQHLAIACANLVHFQDEIQGLFSEWAGERGHAAAASPSGAMRRRRSVSKPRPASSAAIPSFLNVTP